MRQLLSRSTSATWTTATGRALRENEKFSPESQLKIPLLIAYFKWSETNPLVLRKKIFYRGVGGPFEPHYLRSPKPLEPEKNIR